MGCLVPGSWGYCIGPAGSWAGFNPGSINIAPRQSGGQYLRAAAKYGNVSAGFGFLASSQDMWDVRPKVKRSFLSPRILGAGWAILCRGHNGMPNTGLHKDGLDASG